MTHDEMRFVLGHELGLLSWQLRERFASAAAKKK
jgi:hypothetical protein